MPRLKSNKNRPRSKSIYKYKNEYREFITTKWLASLFKYGATKYQIMKSFIARFPLPNNTRLNIKTHIVTINVPILIGLDMFMEHGMKKDFENHQLTCRKENWKISLKYLSWHVYIKPKPKTQICNSTLQKLRKMHYHCMNLSSGHYLNYLRSHIHIT